MQRSLSMQTWFLIHVKIWVTSSITDKVFRINIRVGTRYKVGSIKAFKFIVPNH